MAKLTTKFKSLKKTTKVDFATYLGVIAVFIVVTVLQNGGMLNRKTLGLLVPICCYMSMAVSLNLTVGILGELSLGHAGFMSVGAFSGTLVYVVLHETAPQPLAMLLAFVVGGVVAGLFGFLVGIPVLRLSGDYLAIVTLAFGEIVKNVMNACYLGLDSRGLHFSLKDSASLNLEVDGKVLINGAMGITGIKKASTFTIGIVLVIITLLVILNLVNSRAGRAITAIRDNEIAARAMGINVTFYKLFVFIVSAFFAGIAGVIYGHLNTPIIYTVFSYNYSIEILVMVVLGGMGSINGSIIAATLITYINFVLQNELSGDLAALKLLIYALILIIAVLFNNAPALRPLREKLNLRNLAEKLSKRSRRPENIRDDDAAWNRIDTKIKMDEILSVELQPNGAFEPDRKKKKKEEE